jgi:hypothetical protein
MRNATTLLAGCLVVAAGAWFVGCNSTIDDEDGPAVVLEVENLQIPPISTTQDSSGTCTFTVSNATATFKNLPKNALATESPFNDIILQSLDIAYVWDDGVAMSPVTTGLGGSVPANGTSSGQFAVVSIGDLVSGNRAGHSAALMLTFRGTTVSGDSVSVTTGGTLQVNSCAASAVGACCTGTGICSQLTALNCQNAGGIYGGDNTSCITTVCP